MSTSSLTVPNLLLAVNLYLPESLGIRLVMVSEKSSATRARSGRGRPSTRVQPAVYGGVEMTRTWIYTVPPTGSETWVGERLT